MKFSLALISDCMSTSSGQVTRLRGSRYVVCVTDSPNSWSAFQLTCRLAKECDSIYLVHIPTIHYWDLEDPNAPSYHSYNPNNPSQPQQHIHKTPYISDNRYITRATMTYQQYRSLLASAHARTERIASHYRNLGYNVITSDLTSYFELTERIMKNYSLQMRYNKELYEHPEIYRAQTGGNSGGNSGKGEKSTLPFDRSVLIRVVSFGCSSY
jgi:hypothetical protein